MTTSIATATATGPAPAASVESVKTFKAMVMLSLCLLLITVFAGLGVWQWQRLQWKLDLIARIEARVAAPAVAAPGHDQWSQVNAATAEYRRVQVMGRYLFDQQVLVATTTELGQGYWVMTPLVTDQFMVWINRGFVARRESVLPAQRQDTARDLASETSVIGLLRLTEPKGRFLRTNEPATDRWYTRDVTAMSQARSLTTAPYFIDLQAGSTTPSAHAPVAGLTVLNFRNHHLQYALTWWALALLPMGFLWLMWRRSGS